jgi:hypothetical protein
VKNRCLLLLLSATASLILGASAEGTTNRFAAPELKASLLPSRPIPTACRLTTISVYPQAWSAWGTTNKLKGLAIPPAQTKNPALQLAPGVYETAPYTCIVVVPGGHADDAIAKGTPGTAPEMPTITPDLQFRPRGKK